MADCIAVSDRISVVPTELGVPGLGDPACPPGRQVGPDALSSSFSSSWRSCQFPFPLSAPHWPQGLFNPRALMGWKGNKSAERERGGVVGGRLVGLPASANPARGVVGLLLARRDGLRGLGEDTTTTTTVHAASLTAASPPLTSLG